MTTPTLRSNSNVAAKWLFAAQTCTPCPAGGVRFVPTLSPLLSSFLNFFDETTSRPLAALGAAVNTAANSFYPVVPRSIQPCLAPSRSHVARFLIILISATPPPPPALYPPPLALPVK